MCIYSYLHIYMGIYIIFTTFLPAIGNDWRGGPCARLCRANAKHPPLRLHGPRPLRPARRATRLPPLRYSLLAQPHLLKLSLRALPLRYLRPRPARPARLPPRRYRHLGPAALYPRGIFLDALFAHAQTRQPTQQLFAHRTAVRRLLRPLLSHRRQAATQHTPTRRCCRLAPLALRLLHRRSHRLLHLRRLCFLSPAAASPLPRRPRRFTAQLHLLHRRFHIQHVHGCPPRYGRRAPPPLRYC